jgi:hypothetical protein
MGVPQERWSLARQDCTTVVLPINQNRVLDSDIYLLHLEVTEREMCITTCHAQHNGNCTFVVSPSSNFFVDQA